MQDDLRELRSGVQELMRHQAEQTSDIKHTRQDLKEIKGRLADVESLKETVAIHEDRFCRHASWMKILGGAIIALVLRLAVKWFGA